MVIFIPQNIRMGKITDMFGKLNFGFHKTNRFNPKLMLQLEQTTNSY